MNRQVARDVLRIDLEFLGRSAHRLEDRMRSAVSKYLALTTGVLGGLTAIGNIINDGNHNSLPSLVRANYIPLAGMAIALAWYGWITMLQFGRDRKLYRKILNAINSMRTEATSTIVASNAYTQLWNRNMVRAWPPDSATTIALLSLGAVASVFTFIGIAMAGMPPSGAVYVTLLIASIISAITIRISK